MDDKKVTYEKANAEIVYFENDDVITTSGKNFCMTSNGFENGF